MDEEIIVGTLCAWSPGYQCESLGEIYEGYIKAVR